MPTWHQAWVLYDQLGGKAEKIPELWISGQGQPIGDELLSLYSLLLDLLSSEKNAAEAIIADLDES